MSEKSTRKAPDYAFKSRAARNRSVFRPELQLYRCHTAEERYNPSKSGLKKEIPGTILDCGAAPGRANFPGATSPFYKMELEQIQQRGYQQILPIPPGGK